MAINLNTLYEATKDQYKLQCLAGKQGLGKIVSWIHYMEDITTIDFIRGNELIITTGMSSKGDLWLMDLIEKLIQENATGIIVNIGNYIKEIPEGILEQCEEKQFPIFTMPWKIHLVDITHDFCNRILKEKQEQSTITASFRRAIFSEQEIKADTFEELGYNAYENYLVAIVNDVELMRSRDRQERGEEMEALVNRCTNKNQGMPCVLVQDTNWIIIVPAENQEEQREFAKKFMEETKRLLYLENIQIGLGSISKGLNQLKVAYKEALDALSVAQRKNEKIIFYQEMGVYKILLNVEDPEKLKIIFHEYLGELDEYDRKHKSDYLKTLKLYLKHNGSVQEVAKETFTHRNTVNYRMKKMKEISQHNFEDETTKFMMRLSFYIKDIMPWE